MWCPGVPSPCEAISAGVVGVVDIKTPLKASSFALPAIFVESQIWECGERLGVIHRWSSKGKFTSNHAAGAAAVAVAAAHKSGTVCAGSGIIVVVDCCGK